VLLRGVAHRLRLHRPSASASRQTRSDDGGCGVIPIDEAHRLTNLYTVSFMKRTIGRAQDGWYTQFLTPAYPDLADLAVDYSTSLRVQ
jgi:hypothetical protein